MAHEARIYRRQMNPQLRREKFEGFRPPAEGWIRAIRAALGMGGSQLARRLKVKPQTIRTIEEAEKKGAITVNTLKKVADALHCDVKLVLIPREPLDEIVKSQARKVAEKVVGRTNLHMSLENQGTSPEFLKSQIEDLTEEMVRTADRRIWDDF